MYETIIQVMRVTSCVVAARVWCLPGIAGAVVEEIDSSDPYSTRFRSIYLRLTLLGPRPQAAGRRFSGREKWFSGRKSDCPRSYKFD